MGVIWRSELPRVRSVGEEEIVMRKA